MGLRAKLTSVFIPLLIFSIIAVSALEVNHTLMVMVTDLGDSGTLLINETFEQMRTALSHPLDPAGNPIEVLHRDDALRALLESSQAFGKAVVYARIESPEGTILLSGLKNFEGQEAPTVPSFDELKARAASWWPPSRIRALWENRTYEISRPVDINGKPFAMIKVGVSTGLISAQVHRSVESIAAIGGAAILLSVFVAMVFGSLLLSEVTAISTGVEQLAAGRDEVKLEVAASDELGALAQKFNKLSHRIRTDRTQWENERGQFFNIFRSITDAVLLLDSAGAVLFANAEAQGRLGLPAGGLAEGKQLTVLLGRKHPLSRMIEAAYAAGTEVHDVALELRDNGETTRFLVSIFSLGRGPEPPGLLIIVRDLEPVQELENVVDYSGRLARLGGLISGVAHQIRNPLNAMNLQLELLNQDVSAGKPVDARLLAVRKEIGRLDQAVDALMRFMRPEQLKLGDMSINDLLSEVGAMVSRPNIKVEYRLDQHLPGLRADLALLREAVRNMANNAVDSMMPNGGKLTLSSKLLPDNVIEFSISDQGCGIPPENLERIFNLYFTTKKEGNGLGLSLALRAIDLHHGTLHVDSKIGVGTTMTVRIPVSEQPRLAAAATAAR